jgi:hypothetical protein
MDGVQVQAQRPDEARQLLHPARGCLPRLQAGWGQLGPKHPASEGEDLCLPQLFRPQGGPSPRMDGRAISSVQLRRCSLQVKLSRSAGRVELSISDEGPGL